MNKFIKSQIFLFIVFTALFFTPDTYAAGLILGVAGAAVGSLFGPIGAQIGWMVGAALGNMLFQKGTNKEGPKLQDLHVQTNTVGVAIADIWGTVCGSGNIIWCPGFTEHKHEEKQGKGGPSNTYTSYTYTVNLAIGLCAGPIYGIRRIFANEKLVYDASTGNEGGTGEFRKYMRIYKGTEEQMPDPLMQQVYKDYTPAYRGLAYIVLQDLPLEDYGNQIPSLKFEIIRTPDDVGQDSYGAKPYDYKYNDVIFSSSIYSINTFNNYIYRYSESTVTNTNLIQKINPNTYKVEKTAIVPKIRQLIGGNSVAYEPFLYSPNGNIFWPYCPGGLSDLNIYIVSPDNLNYTTVVPKDLCYKDDQGNWQGPFADFMTYNIKYFYGMKTISDSRSLGFGTSGGSNKCYFVSLTPGSGTARELNLPKGRNVYYNNETAFCGGNPEKDFFYITLGDDKFFYLNSLQKGFDLVKIGPANPLGLMAFSFFYDEVAQKIFLVYYDAYISNSKRLLKIDIKTKTIEKEINLDGFNDRQFYLSFGYDSVNRKIMATASSNINTGNKYFIYWDFDTLNYSEKLIDIKKTNSKTLGGAIRPIYNSIADHYVYSGTSITQDFNNVWMMINRGNRYDFGTYPLPEVVRELCVRTGIPSEKIDTTDLNGIAVKGYVRANRTTCRSMLEMLAAIYNFDAVESFGTIKFVKRGKDSVATISWEELGAKIYSNNQPAQDIFKSTRTQEIDLPKVANILYYDRDKDYAQNTQESKRVIETTENVYTLETPAVLVPNEAKQIIDRVMYQTWTARDKYQFQTNMDYAALEPTDVIKVAKGDMTYSMRITKKDESQGVCKYEAEAEDKTVYDQNGEGDSGLKPDQNITVTSDTTLILLDIPIFDKSDDNSGVYALFEKTDPKGYWKGAVIYKSQTTNGNFSQVDGSGAFSTTGGCLTALPDWNGINTINYSDSVVVELLNGELEGISEDDILNGHNLCVIGNEVLQFKEAVFIDTNTYRLSGFLRARFGTEQWAINHTTADRFALLEFDQSKIMRINKNDSMFGVEKYYKSVTLGKKIADAPIIPFTNQGNGYKPYAVSNIIHNIKEDGSYNFEFDYRGRGRVTFDDTIPVDIDGDPSFEVDILDSKSKIVRTILTKTNSFDYTAEQQKEDFGATTNNFSLNIYKLNNTIGRGFAKSYSI